MSAAENRVLFTVAALCAFAGNSLLTRLALGRATIDATTFTAVRLAAGAAMLLLVTGLRRRGALRISGSWLSATVLFLYALPFSYAYVNLTAGTGALILVGSVQLTMMLAALWDGERPHALQWLGLSLVLAGLVYLVLPGLAAPSHPRFGFRCRLPASPGVLLAPRQGRGQSTRTDHEQFRALSSSHGHRRRDGEVPPALRANRYASWCRVWRLDVRHWLRVVVRGGERADGHAGPPSFSSRSQFSPAQVACCSSAKAVSRRLMLSAAVVLGGISLALIGREKL